MNDSGSQPSEEDLRWQRLTEKQHACLRLLVDHKTSKEIARSLDISKHTVDQRLDAARHILGARDRNETAFRYRELQRLYDRMTYDAVEVPASPPMVRSRFPDGNPPNLMELDERMDGWGESPKGDAPFGGLWRRDHSSAARLWIYLGGLAIMVWICLGGLGVAQALSQLLSN